MSFGGLILTSSGRNLLAKAQAGKELKFTRVGLGDGALGAGSITDLQSLRSEVKSLDITNLEVIEGNAEVTTFLSNAKMVEGFYLREIGLFALDPDLGEILYCYDNSGKDADYIPPEGEIILERNMRFTLIVSNASSVTATIDRSLVFVTKKEFDDLEDKIAGEISGIDVPVKSVNTKTGHVTLTASDVGAVPIARKVNNKALSADITLTKADVVLGSVENYGVATTAEAQAGVVDNKYMTPKKTMDAVVGGFGGMRRRVFTDNGRWVVPPGVTTIYLTACGGGGGGDSDGGANSASAGSPTILSGIATLPGGGGGKANFAGNVWTGTGGVSGGEGGGKGHSYAGSNNRTGGGGSYGSGGTSSELPGIGTYASESAHMPTGGVSSQAVWSGTGNTGLLQGAGYGAGGGGLSSGGGAACVVGKPYPVTPNQTIDITIGNGGFGLWEPTGGKQGIGGKGIVIIEW